MKIVRAIERENKKRKKDSPEYFEISIPDDVLLGIFGARIFDKYTRQWIEDDFLVIWARPIGQKEAAMIRLYVKDFDFDFDNYNYYLSTSQQ
jgi:hypothetical protein